MQIWQGLESITEQFPACTLAIGMFDGVHIGHQALIKAAVADAKLSDGPKVTPHDARHAFVSQAADLGLSSDEVAGIVGHTSAKVTEGIYTHSFNRDEREARQREAMSRMAGASS